MAEKSRSGREPISVIELSQDFCNESWSTGNCTAGNSNYITGSEIYAPTAGQPWTMPDWEGTVGQTSGPTGAADRIEFEKVSTGTSDEIKLTSIAMPEGETLRFSGYFKRTNGAFSNNTVRVYIQTSTGEAGAAMDYEDGTTANGVEKLAGGGALESFDTVTSTDAGSGWWRFEVTLAASRVVNPASFGFEFSFDATTTGTGIGLSVGGIVSGAQLMVYTREGQGYVGTTGENIIALSNEPCFNTRQTCQDPTNYDKGVQVLKFVSDRSPQLTDDYYLPMLENVSISPAELNPAGAKKSTSGLGKRATITATFQDAPHTDAIVDPYVEQRSYSPLERGTFWQKWRARNPYYLNRQLDFKTGYFVDGVLTDAVTRSYVITGFSGPDSSGKVTLRGKDILTRAEDSKAQAPNANTGKISSAIAAGDTIPDSPPYTVTLTPAGIGDLEYSASGTCRIKKEIFTFTRSGDVLTLTARAQQGSEASDHAINEVVQECLVYTSQNCSNILYDLLNVYAGIPASYLDKANWDIEQAAHLTNLYSTTISEPTSVSKLISEMCEQMYFLTWWDERASLVKLRALRAAVDDVVTDLDDDNHLIENSISWTDNPDELVTQVWVFHGQINPTVKLEQESNYATAEVVGDFDAEGADRNDTKRIRKVFSRWIDAAGTSAANDLATSIINRYSTLPRTCSFTLDAKDGDLWLADFIRVQNRLNVDIFGNVEQVNLQVMRANETAIGTKFSYAAQQFILQQEVDPTADNLIIGSDYLNVNLYDFYVSQKGVPAANKTITFTVRTGVTIGGDAANYDSTNIPNNASRDSTKDTYDAGTSQTSGLSVGDVIMLQRAGISTPRDIAAGATYPSTSNTADWLIKEYPITAALDTGTSWPANTTLKLIIEAGAYVVGEGGNGSAHVFEQELATGSDPILETAPAGDGGHAMKIQHAIEITNLGTISNGCGGGGSSAWITSPVNPYIFVATGGGGAGYPSRAMSSIEIGAPSGFNMISDAQVGTQLTGGNGAEGLYTGSAFGSPFYYAFNSSAVTSARGNGGSSNSNAGQQGNVDSDTGGGISYPLLSGTGGTGGDAIVSGYNLVTWTGGNEGDIRGAKNT